MGASERRKGLNFERHIAQITSDSLSIEIKRNLSQYRSAKKEGADIVFEYRGDRYSIECKIRKRIANIKNRKIYELYPCIGILPRTVLLKIKGTKDEYLIVPYYILLELLATIGSGDIMEVLTGSHLSYYKVKKYQPLTWYNKLKEIAPDDICILVYREDRGETYALLSVHDYRRIVGLEP